MKLKDLTPKLQALNPEAEVYVEGGGVYETEGPQLLERIRPGRFHFFMTRGRPYKDGSGYVTCEGDSATPSDTLIVLSE